MRGINNWDLVDGSAPYIVGSHLLHGSRAILRKVAKSDNIWERRIAIVSTLAFIREKSLRDTFEISEMLLGDSHALIHKAVGWMLREAGKQDEAALKAFLRKHHARMPRTGLRYAIERFSPEIRRSYLKGEVPA
jgi:3-methyladenine DNA glycosylase AlkD